MNRFRKTVRILPSANLILLCLVMSGCATVRLNNADRLMARPDFKAAKDAAPEFTRDALKTINALEHELEAR